MHSNIDLQYVSQNSLFSWVAATVQETLCGLSLSIPFSQHKKALSRKSLTYQFIVLKRENSTPVLQNKIRKGRRPS